MAALSPGAQELARLAGLDGKSLRAAQRYRVGTTHALGNAINEKVATEFVAAAMESLLPFRP